MKMRSVNPYNEKVLGEFDTLSSRACRAEIEHSQEAYASWRNIPLAERTLLISQAAKVLRTNAPEYARIITREMGKPIKEALAEVNKCAWVCDYYAENAAQFLAPELIQTEYLKSYVAFEPLGIILGIMPWNFPFWQVFRFAIPALAVGNVCLLKHASNVPMSALEIESVFREAGFPPNVFKTLLMTSSVTMQMINEDLVDGVSLTGSEKAGSAVGALAGKRIKELVLELGGSDPFIVLEDADLDRAVQMATISRFLNTGQSCIAAKRFIVRSEVVQQFTDKLIEAVNNLIVGNPLDEETTIGPLAKQEFVDDLKDFLTDAEAKGAQIIEGSTPQRTDDKGFFFTPTILTKVTAEMRVCHEEVFGPLVPIIIVSSDDEAVAVANSVDLGLGGAVWSSDLVRAETLARRIETGHVAVNDMVKSDPRLPFGGIKKSGVGRELSHYGIKEFANIKTVVVHE